MAVKHDGRGGDTKMKLERALRAFVKAPEEERKEMGARKDQGYRTLTYGRLRDLAGTRVACNGMGPFLNRIREDFAKEDVRRIDAAVVTAKTGRPGAGYSPSRTYWEKDLDFLFADKG